MGRYRSRPLNGHHIGLETGSDSAAGRAGASVATDAEIARR